MKNSKININILITLLLFISLWMNYSNYGQIQMLRSELGRASNMLQRDVNNVANEVSRVLNDFKKESMWVRESSNNIMDFSDDLKDTEIDIEITLNEKNKDEKLYIIAATKENNEIFKFEVPNNNDLIFKANIRLPVDYNYEMQLIGENDTFSRSSPLDSLYLRNFVSEIIQVDGDLLGGQYYKDEQKGEYSFFIAVSQMKKSKEMFVEYLSQLQITEVKADVYHGDQYIKTIDLLNGTNYIPKDIDNLSNAIPEIAANEYRAEFERKHFFSGIFEMNGESDFSQISLVITVKDNKGHTYQKIVGDERFFEEEKEIK